MSLKDYKMSEKPLKGPRKSNDEIRIIQITSQSLKTGDKVLGLGSDNQMYAWNWDSGEWEEYKRG